MKVAGIIDRNDSNWQLMHYSDPEGYRNAVADTAADYTNAGPYQGFRWASAPRHFPMFGLSYTYQNQTQNTMLSLSTTLGTSWMARMGGYPEAFCSGSCPRGVPSNASALPSHWPPSLGTDFAGSGIYASGKARSWLTGSTWQPVAFPMLGEIAVVPRPGAAGTLAGLINAGYVFYPHYARVMTPRVQGTGGIPTEDFEIGDMTGGDYDPPLQFSHHSGAFSEKCVKNHMFGVGSLMFAPEPIWVFASSSKDTIYTSPSQWGKYDAATHTVPYCYNSWGNASHLDWFCGKPRGWRYGLLNAFPTKPTCAYRRDHYGQFRDMLEQRPYTAFYRNDPPDVASMRREQGLRVRRRRRPRRFAIKATFRTPVWKDPTSTDFMVPASETQCSNLSAFATSSLPYFDGEVKNRGDLPSSDEVVVT